MKQSNDDVNFVWMERQPTERRPSADRAPRVMLEQSQIHSGFIQLVVHV